MTLCMKEIYNQKGIRGGTYMTPIEEVMKEIVKLCEKHDVEQVILFGSRAKGTALERSDIDIAVSGVKDFGSLEEEMDEKFTKRFQAGMISDDVWMEMLKIRNQLVHDYDGEIVKSYCHTIVDTYIDKMYEFDEYVTFLLEEIKDTD